MSAKVRPTRTAKVVAWIAKPPEQRGKGSCALVQSKLVQSAKAVLQGGITGPVSSMSLIKSLLKESLQEVSSGRSCHLPLVVEGY
jgi:hypothetical protein